MAHDSQLPKELQAEPKSESRKPTGKRKESLEVLADWWSIYGQIYRDDPTELLAVAFRETLQDLPAKVLHEACLKAQRESQEFRPKPGRVYAIAEAILERTAGSNRPKYLDEPVTSQEERDRAMQETEATREALRKSLGLKAGA